MAVFLWASFLFVEPLATAAEKDDPAAISSEPGRSTVRDADARVPSEEQITNDLLSLDIDELANVPVKQPSNASKTGIPSSTVQIDDSSTTQPKTTAELLQGAASVTTRRTSAVNLDPTIRGYNSQQMVAVADGANQLKTRVDIDSLFSQVQPGIVESIEVIDGPYSSLYGPGFAFMIASLAPAPRYANGPESHSATSFTWGSNGQSISGRETVQAGDQNWGFLASYGVRTANDYRSGSDLDFLVPSSYHGWDGFLTTSFDLSRESRMEFQYLHNELNNLELPGIVYDIENSTNDQFNFRYVLQEDRDGPENVVLQYWLHQTDYRGDASRSSKQATLYEQFFTLPSSDELPVNTIVSGMSDSMGARALFTLGDTDSPQWTLGVDWRHSQIRYVEFEVDAGNQVIFNQNFFGIPSSQQHQIGLLTQYTLAVADRLLMSLGGRLDYVTSSLNENDSVVTQIDDPNNAYFGPGYEEPNQTLGMTYLTGKVQLTDELDITAGTAFAMRAPTLAELYSDEPYVPLYRFGNSYVDGFSGLDPEQNLQTDLGISWKNEHFRFGARGFYSTVWDYIMAVPTWVDPAPPDASATHTLGRDFSGFDPDGRGELGTGAENADQTQAGYLYANLDRASLWGTDLFLEVRPRAWLAVVGTLSYVQGTNHTPVRADISPDGSSIDGLTPLGGHEPLPGIYPLHGSIRFRLLEPNNDRWAVDFITRLVADQDRVARSVSELPTSGFAVFDLRGYYRPTEKLRFTAGIENLLDRSYTEHGSLVIYNPKAGRPIFVPEPGINVALGVEYVY